MARISLAAPQTISDRDISVKKCDRMLTDRKVIDEVRAVDACCAHSFDGTCRSSDEGIWCTGRLYLQSVNVLQNHSARQTT